MKVDSVLDMKLGLKFSHIFKVVFWLNLPHHVTQITVWDLESNHSVQDCFKCIKSGKIHVPQY